MTKDKEGIYCLWKHLKSFYEQARYKKIADFGEPCCDCKNRETCKCDWISKTGRLKPSDVKISMASLEQK